MNDTSKYWPRTLTSGVLAGRTFSSEQAYRLALGEARLEGLLEDSARRQLEELIAAHDATMAAERQATEARKGFDGRLTRTAQELSSAWRR